MAVNVTLVPEQIPLLFAAMETETGKLGFTVMVIWFEVAGFPEGQATFEVKTQVILSVFTKVFEL